MVEKERPPLRQQCFNKGWISWITFAWTLFAWALVWVPDKSCQFVYLTGHDKLTGEELSSGYFIYRGIQRGMMEPNDSCESWRDVPLDSKMIASRVSAALSIVIGLVLWIYVLLVALCRNDNFASGRCICCSTCLHRTTSCRALKWIVAFLAICVATFQALTHLIVKSDMCEEADPVQFLVSGRTVVYDTCLKSTPAYNMTFATMGLWVIAAIRIGLQKLPEKGEHCNEVESDTKHILPTTKNTAEENSLDSEGGT